MTGKYLNSKDDFAFKRIFGKENKNGGTKLLNLDNKLTSPSTGLTAEVIARLK